MLTWKIEKFEDTKGVSDIANRRRTDHMMAREA
jgi:hypothetical protein